MSYRMICAGLVTAIACALASGCSTVREVGPHSPADIAKGEAQRRGWKQVHVDVCRFRDGFWWVYVYKRPLKIAGNDAWVQIDADGRVVSFDVNTK